MSLLVSTLRHPERSEGSPECGTVLIPEILRCAQDDVALGGTGRSITDTCVDTYGIDHGIYVQKAYKETKINNSS